MSHMRQILISSRTPFALAAAIFSLAGPASAAQCDDPGSTWQTRPASQVDMNAARLQDAIDWTTLHASASVLVFRHGCRVGQSRLDPVTSLVPLDGWSMTKSVTSLLVGRAVTLGLLDVDSPIAPLYPEADAAHGSLTPRELLTMSSGLHINWVRDLDPAMPDRVRDALSLPFAHRPGTWWEYEQSPVTLLANVVERAVKPAGYADVQDFAARELFGPVGIPAGSWLWERDRAGHTEGWAHLHMRSPDWARLGHLVLHGGEWAGERIIASDYLDRALSPDAVNHAYGLLFWLNGGDTYVLPGVEGRDVGKGMLIADAPIDTVLMAGNGEQRVYVIPSRDMVIVRLGENGSWEGDTRASVWTGRAGELDNELVRRVMLAVDDVPYDDPGPYPGSHLVLPPLDRGVVGDARDFDQVLAGAGLGPDAPAGCTPLGCN
jgi:CubicO group peptidase (beta-lactamase class C family)